jgi:hydrogenase expression/formation protein HypC
MCLGVPVKILEVKDNYAWVEIGGIRREISIELLEDVKVGEYVIVHAGFAIQKLDEKEAEETLKILKEIEII